MFDFIEQMQNFQMQREMEAQQYEKRLKKQKQFIFDLEKEQREILVAMKEDNQEAQIMELNCCNIHRANCSTNRKCWKQSVVA